MKKRIKNLLEFKIRESKQISEYLKTEKKKRKIKGLEKNEVEVTAQIKLLRHILTKEEEKAVKWWSKKSDDEIQQFISEYDLKIPIKNSDILKVWKKSKKK